MTDGSKLQYYRFYNPGGIYEASQSCGLGRVIMEQVMDFIHGQRKPGYKFMVSLKFGFVVRTNDDVGHGIHQGVVNE